LLVLSIVLLSPVASSTQGIVAVMAVLTFVAGFSMGLGAGAPASLLLFLSAWFVFHMFLVQYFSWCYSYPPFLNCFRFVFLFCTVPCSVLGCMMLALCAVVWTVMSEIMPTRLRNKAVSVFLSVNWGCNLIIGMLTLTAIDQLGGVTNSMDDDETASAEKNGVAYLYFIFAGFTVACLLFLHIYVPETKGITFFFFF
jgi:hypothetical protein